MSIHIPDWGRHALSAARRHGITEEQMAETWLFGLEERGKDNCWRIVGKDVTLIMDKKWYFIVTVYPNQHKDRFKAVKAAIKQEKGEVTVR